MFKNKIFRRRIYYLINNIKNNNSFFFVHFFRESMNIENALENQNQSLKSDLPINHDMLRNKTKRNEINEKIKENNIEINKYKIGKYILILL